MEVMEAATTNQPKTAPKPTRPRKKIAVSETAGAANAIAEIAVTKIENEERRLTRTAVIVARLEAKYGEARWRPGLAPLEELIACVLSQHTSDINSGRAFERLKAQYPTWEAALSVPTKELADTIRCGGLADSKAPRIQAILRTIQVEHGAITLDFLETMPDVDARAYLMNLPGVGPKTAAIVLCFAMGRPVLPVDTHVFRVAWRLGLIEKRIGEAKAHDALQAQIRPEQTYDFHVGLIRHGRQTCKAIVPRCALCPITDLCRYFQTDEGPKG